MNRLYVKDRYGQIPNHILNNPTLSLKAKGLWVYIQSKPDGWNFSIERMTKQLKEGKASIQHAIWELEKARLLVREQAKDTKGKWKGYDYFLYEKPLPKEPSVEKPSAENSSTGSSADISKRDIDSYSSEDSFNSSESTACNECSNEPSKKEDSNKEKANKYINNSFKENNKKNINNNLYSSKHSIKKSEFISGTKNPNSFSNENPNSFTPSNNSYSYKSPDNLSPENIKKQRVLFEKFWTQYPRKVNKVGALAEWLKINPDEALFNQIMEGLENYIKYEWPNAELNFIVYPSTFLAQRRWEDKPGVQYPRPKKVWATTEEEKDGLYDTHIKPFVSGILKDV